LATSMIVARDARSFIVVFGVFLHVFLDVLLGVFPRGIQESICV
jgi:hypothetical protein